MIIPNRDNSGINYPQSIPVSYFAIVIYIFFANRGSNPFRKKFWGDVYGLYPRITVRKRGASLQNVLDDCPCPGIRHK
jgi:hypothetical protein